MLWFTSLFLFYKDCLVLEVVLLPSTVQHQLVVIIVDALVVPEHFAQMSAKAVHKEL